MADLSYAFSPFVSSLLLYLFTYATSCNTIIISVCSMWHSHIKMVKRFGGYSVFVAITVCLRQSVNVNNVECHYLTDAAVKTPNMNVVHGLEGNLSQSKIPFLITTNCRTIEIIKWYMCILEEFKCFTLIMIVPLVIVTRLLSRTRVTPLSRQSFRRCPTTTTLRFHLSKRQHPKMPPTHAKEWKSKRKKRSYL